MTSSECQCGHYSIQHGARKDGKGRPFPCSLMMCKCTDFVSVKHATTCAVCGHASAEHVAHSGRCEHDRGTKACTCQAYIDPTSNQGVAMTASTTQCICTHPEADHLTTPKRACLASCKCQSFDSVFYADMQDICDCSHERGGHQGTRLGLGAGPCASQVCKCMAFKLDRKVPSQGGAGTRSPQPAYLKGPLAGGLGSGAHKAANKVTPVAVSGKFAPSINIATWDEDEWDCIFNFISTTGATPTPADIHDCIVKLNFNPPVAEVWVDGEQIPSDPSYYDEAVAVLRQRILTEGSWAVAARDTLTDS